MHTVKIAVHSAEGCCTAATIMALTSIKQKFTKDFLHPPSHISNASFHFRLSILQKIIAY